MVKNAFNFQSTDLNYRQGSLGSRFAVNTNAITADMSVESDGRIRSNTKIISSIFDLELKVKFLLLKMSF